MYSVCFQISSRAQVLLIFLATLTILLLPTLAQAQESFPGNALRFTGIDNQWVDLGTTGSLGLTDELTVEVWLKVPADHPPGERGGVVLSNYPLDPSIYLEVYIHGRLRFNTSGAAIICTNPSILDGLWHHVAVTRSLADDEMRVYLDGVVVGTTTAGANFDLHWPLALGNDYRGTANPLNGTVDELRIWSVARTPQQLRQNMHLTLTGTEPGLISYWQLNMGWGTTVIDVVGGHDGTFSGLTTSAWTTSQVIIGSGQSASQIVALPGVYDFLDASMSIDFTAKTGTDTVVVSRLDLEPSLQYMPGIEVFRDQYWVINSFGNGTYSADLTFQPNESIAPCDNVVPSPLHLYTREIRDTGIFAHNGLADAADGHANTATFGNYSADFGQFVVGRARFTDVEANLPPVSDCDAAWGDYDNDGDLDLAYNGWIGGGRLSGIYRNDAGQFTDIGAGLPGISEGALDWGDFDNDGDLDLALSGRHTSGAAFAAIYRNDAGVFVDIEAGLVGVLSSALDWGDFDNDGDQDLALIGSTDSFGPLSRIYRNDAGVFTNVGANLQDFMDGTAQWGDYDNDGDLDLLLCGRGDVSMENTWIYRNDNGNFTALNADLPDLYSSDADWGDFDNDGDLDLVIAGLSSGSGAHTKILRNNAGTFVDIGAGLPAMHDGSVDWGDYDNDGDLDVALIGHPESSSTTVIYENRDVSMWVEVDSGLPDLDHGHVSWGDYDNDGDLDLLVSGEDYGTHGTYLYRNNTLTQNDPPIAPGGLAVSTATGGIRLSWDGASDYQTPTAGLTYELRVGTTPGGRDLVAPRALDSGLRTVSEMGNVNHNTSWILDLPLDGFYWSVQAVDGTGVGSAFAAEAYFTAVPILTAIEDIAADQGGNLRLTWSPSGFDYSGSAIPITGYEVYRRQDAKGNPKLAGWDFISWTPAHGEEVYQYVAPSLCDSIADGGICWSVFMVRAATADPFVFADSAPDSGYSVDNLAPSVPAGFSYIGDEMLAWDPPTDDDFDYFTVYGSADEVFGDTAVLIGHTIGREMDVAGQTYARYHLTATDFSGNESQAATVAGTTGVPADLPLSFALHPPWPNPFNPRTIIRYDLPERSAVRLTVYDLSGRLVKTLIGGQEQAAGSHTVMWQGRDDTGRRLSSGTYVYKITAGRYVDTRCMTLLK